MIEYFGVIAKLQRSRRGVVGGRLRLSSYFLAGSAAFLAGSTTSQELLCQVGTPSLGRIQRVKTSHATKKSASPIHWFIFKLILMHPRG